MLHTKSLVKSLFEVLSDNTEDIIVLLSVDGRILSINGVVQDLSGDPPETFVGNQIEVFLCTKKLTRQVQQEIRTCVDTGRPCSFEIDLPEGQMKGNSFQVNLIPVLADEDSEELSGVLAIMRDITSMRKLLAEKEQQIQDHQLLSQRLISKANKLQSFSYIISHNLRAPIASLAGLLELFNHAQDEQEKQEIVTMFSKSVDRLKEIVEDLTEIIKINQDIDIKLEEIEFDEALNAVSESIAHLINETGTAIRKDFRACKRFVYSKAYIESILLNMITNSIKYRHPKRNPAIEIMTWKNGNDAILTFRDNGIGIDLNLHGDKIFGLRKTFHGNQDARGVGLFITKTQVEALGGSISIESRVGIGTTFTVRFPQKFE